MGSCNSSRAIQSDPKNVQSIPTEKKFKCVYDNCKEDALSGYYYCHTHQNGTINSDKNVPQSSITSLPIIIQSPLAQSINTPSVITDVKTSTNSPNLIDPITLLSVIALEAIAVEAQCQDHHNEKQTDHHHHHNQMSSHNTSVYIDDHHQSHHMNNMPVYTNNDKTTSYDYSTPSYNNNTTSYDYSTPSYDHHHHHTD